MVETIFCSRYTSFYFISCPLPSLLILWLCLFSLRRPFPPPFATTPNDLFRLHHQRISKTWTVKCFYAGKYESRIRSISPSDDPFLSLSLSPSFSRLLSPSILSALSFRFFASTGRNCPVEQTLHALHINLEDDIGGRSVLTTIVSGKPARGERGRNVVEGFSKFFPADVSGTRFVSLDDRACVRLFETRTVVKT